MAKLASPVSLQASLLSSCLYLGWITGGVMACQASAGRGDTKIYEIHYLHYGKKKTVIHHALKMNDFLAWYLAAVASGVPEEILPKVEYVSLIITASENQGITKVRWNLAPRQYGYG